MSSPDTLNTAGAVASERNESVSLKGCRRIVVPVEGWSICGVVANASPALREAVVEILAKVLVLEFQRVAEPTVESPGGRDREQAVVASKST